MHLEVITSKRLTQKQIDLIWCYVVGMHSLFQIIMIDKLWRIKCFVICILNQYKYYNQYTIIYAGYNNYNDFFLFHIRLTIYKYLAAAWTDNLRKVFKTKLN